MIKGERYMADDPKKYEFNNTKDIIIYSNLMIELTIKHYNRYTHYFQELEDLYLNTFSKITNQELEEVRKYSAEYLLENKDILFEYLNNKESYKIKYYDFKSIGDKLNTPKLTLTNLIGDRTKDAVSYLGFRDRINKYNNQCGSEKIQLQELDEEKRRILNKFNNVRNYEHHITDAKFIEWKNYREKQIQKSPLTEWPSNIISINTYDFVEAWWLFDFYHINKNFKKDIKIVIQQMKKDYSKLIGKSIEIRKNQIDTLPIEFSKISRNGVKRHLGKIK